METYKVVFNEGETEGVYAVSLVEDPAIGVEFIKLSKQTEVKLATVNEEKRVLLGAILIPDLPIYRRMNDREFNIIFDAQTIEKIQENFKSNGYQNNSTIEHEGKNLEGVTFVESWIKEDEQLDKSVKYGFNEPVGTWFMKMKVNNDEVWNDYVKTGKVKGFSIDGVFDLEKINLSTNMNLESIVNAIKDGFASLKLSEESVQNTEVSLSEELLADGVTKVFAEAFEVGQAVFIVAEDGTQTPAPAGEHTLISGKVIVVDEAGVIVEVKEMEAEPAVEVEIETEMTNEAPSVEEIVKAVIAQMSIEVGKQIEAVKTELKAEFSKPNEVVKTTAATKAKPETATQVVNLKKMTKKEQIAFNLKNLK